MIRIIFWSLLIFKVFATDSSNEKECVTPYGETATCLPIPACPVISSVLFTLTDRAIQFVNDSQCGCDGGMVCCGSYTDKFYPQLINCVPVQRKIIVPLSDVSDPTICGLDSQTDRIVGGGATTAEEFPWLAALEYRNKKSKENAGIRCGGSIVSRRFILTAAHCIEDVEFEIIKVWLGVTNLSSNGSCFNTNGNIECIETVQKLNVQRTIPHELYNSISKLNDMGLLQLEADIQFTKYIRPICLPSRESTPLSIGSYLMAAGWGITENGKPSDVKLKVKVPLKDNQLCQEYLTKRFQNITSKQLCVGGVKGADSCLGDSGGPLMYAFIGANGDVQWFQEGIVSYGTGCGIQELPSVYVKVSSYVNWIHYKFLGRTHDFEEDEPCRTSTGTIGTCVDVNTCPEFFNQIYNKSEYNNYKYQDKQCSLVFDALVCCKNPGSIIKADLNPISVLPDKTTCGIVKEEDEIGFPWIAGIEVLTGQSNRTEIRCLGTVIHSRYIFTSVECALGEEEDIFEPINVWLGRWNSSGNNSNAIQKIRIKKIIAYPLNIPNLLFHALILLENEIKFSDDISPICLDSLNLPKKQSELLTTLWPKNVSRTEPITSSDAILKTELSLSYCWDALCPVDYNCSYGALIGSPIMRKYKNQVNGRTQWYLVSVDTTWHYSCARMAYYPTIMASLNQIITIISQHS